MVQLTRPFPGDATCNGFILAVGEEWVLVQQEYDFSLWGYVALRVTDISEIRSGKHERKWEEILAGEGILDQVGIGHEVDLRTTRSLVQCLQRLGRCIIVECEDQEDSDADEFYIGQIVELDDSCVWFVHFDALGKWEKKGTQLPYNEITKIKFNTPYANIFSKYVPVIRPRLHA